MLEQMPSSEPFRFQTRIRFIDTDASGRIHYTAMFRYFESAETEFMREVGVVYEKGGYGFPRVHVECDFMLQLGHDDLINIEVFLTKLGKSSMRFDFRTWKAEELAAKGAVIVVCIDKSTRRAADIPDPLRRRLEEKLSDANLAN